MQQPTLEALRRRAEVLAEFRTCRTPSGCVAWTVDASESERREATGGTDGDREQRDERFRGDEARVRRTALA